MATVLAFSPGSNRRIWSMATKSFDVPVDTAVASTVRTRTVTGTLRERERVRLKSIRANPVCPS
jgi:hypothetical protein